MSKVLDLTRKGTWALGVSHKQNKYKNINILVHIYYFMSRTK